ncbi:MAG: ROK family protein [Cyclobacteriaceae bacterium]
MKKEIAIGIDIGGTNTKFGLVDRNGEIIHQDSMPTMADGNVNDFIKFLHDKLIPVIQSYPDYEVKGVGIGAPNANYYKGTIEYAPNIRWGEFIYFKEAFSQCFDYQMVLTNDANAAALGEMVYGNAQGMTDFIVVTLGTGLGSGIVVNGNLVYGHDGFAGELGHVNVKPDGRLCGCGRRGCLETYVSATGIKRTIFKLMAEETEDSDLRNIPYDELTALMITEAANKQDPLAIKAFQYTGRILGEKLADTVLHTSPEAIFLFGGLVRAGGYLLEPTKKYLEKFIFKMFKNKVKLLPSGLMDKNAAVLGASALVWKEFG